MTRWRGLAELIHDAVHHGTLAVERVHQQVARTPLDVLAQVPPLATAARCAAGLQETLIGTTYAAIRGVNGAVATLAIAALDGGERPADRDGEAAQ